MPSIVLALLTTMAGGCVIQVDAADYIGVCQAGYQRCKGPVVQSCSSDGEEWLTTEICKPDQICRDATCVAADAPLPTPDAGPTDAAADVPPIPPLDIKIPPLPDGGASPVGGVVDVTVRVQIVEALTGGYVDLGFCAGSLAQPVLGGPPACSGSFFLRIERTGTGLWGQLYVHDPSDQTIEPKLWAPDLSEPEPVLMQEDELYEIRFQDTAQPVDDLGQRSMSFQLRGFATGAWASQVVSVPDTSLAAFGLWNLDTTGTDEQALQGAAASMDLEIDRSQSWDVTDFAALAASQGSIVQSGPASPYLDFYVTRAVAGAALLALR